MSLALKPWIMAFRPKTLTAAVIPVLVGISLGASVAGSAPRWDLAIWAILSSMCIQVATNLVNDALDFKKGTDTEKRLGPVRVSAGGLIAPDVVLKSGILFFVVAALLAVPLIQSAGLAILVIGVFSIVSGYVYTGGPYPLAYNGLGDLFVILFFGLIAVAGSYFLQTGSFSIAAVVAGLQVGFLATVLIAINNLRDLKEDSLNRKRTLAVRLGAGFVRREILWLNLLSLILGIFWYFQNYRFWWLPVLSAPLMVLLTLQIYRYPPGKIYNKFLAQAALVHLLFGGLMVAMLLCGRNQSLKVWPM